MNIDVFVSYHTQTSLNIVKAIVNQLESKGLRCWYAPRDVIGVYSGSIIQAIKECRLFLLVLNKAASDSFDVISEINCGVQRIKDGENMVMLPFHIADNVKEMNEDTLYYIKPLHWIDALDPPLVQRINELCDKILSTLGPGSTPEIKPADHSQEEKLISKRPVPREIFYGRDDQLTAVHELFREGKKCVFIEGIGGIGKTELAKQYAVNYQDAFNTVIFLSYQGSIEQLVTDPEGIRIADFEEKKQDEEKRNFFIRKMTRIHQLADENTLFIIDNFDVDNDPDLELFLSGNARVLITSRYHHPQFASLQLGVIEDESMLISVFEKNADTEIEESERDTLLEIFKLVGNHTYAIELIAKQMEASFLSLEEMAALLKKGISTFAGSDSVQGRHHARSSFDHICALFNISGLSETEMQTMRELSLVGYEGVDTRQFKEWGEYPNFEHIRRLIDRNWIRKGKDNRISLHPLISDVVRDLLKPDIDNCRTFLNNLSTRLYRAWLNPVEDNNKLVAPALSILSYFESSTEKTARIFGPIIDFLWVQGYFQEAEYYGLKIFEDNTKSYGEYTHDAGFLAEKIAAIYFNSRRYRESVPWYQKGMEYLEKGAPETVDLVYSYTKYARCFTYDFMKDPGQIEYYLNKAKILCDALIEKADKGEKLNPDIMPSVKNPVEQTYLCRAYIYLELSTLFLEQGRFEDTIMMVNRFAEATETYDSKEGNNYTYVYMHRGICYWKQAQQTSGPERDRLLQMAEEELQIALDRNLAKRGEKTMDSVDCQEYLGDIYELQGRHAEAANAYLAAFEMMSRLVWEDHPRLALLRHKLGM